MIGASSPRIQPGGFSSAARRFAYISAVLTIAYLCGTAAAKADEYAFADAGCELRDGETGVVAAVIDPVSLRLDSGLEVRLAGIRPPGGSDQTAAAAVAFLETLALGQTVMLRYGALERDRYQRATAQVFIGGTREKWLQAELAGAGLALVGGLAEDRACLSDLLAFERAARSANLGVWAARMPLDAWADELRRGELRYELVEGRIVSIGRTERTVYLNFGNDWSIDFTVTIVAADAGAIEAEGGSLDILIGQEVRIRGWLEQWDGPWIRVDHPEQIEVLNRGDGGGVSG
jgi:micrococcal nuclease